MQVKNKIMASSDSYVVDHSSSTLASSDSKCSISTRYHRAQPSTSDSLR